MKAVEALRLTVLKTVLASRGKITGDSPSPPNGAHGHMYVGAYRNIDTLAKSWRLII